MVWYGFNLHTEIPFIFTGHIFNIYKCTTILKKKGTLALINQLLCSW
jgi:hypothetical protein